ncbi:type 1 glutamine amidotransferase domain-containing protein [Zavarzinella formosa]|uniref:type 1 glutamine amidotransferase domain-containing protein n=1 Tax=Zavarzinella formosa TaxID=360055 RepID=UPI0003613386|nr:type 1 glutamine amidotransferase domain-containing protein [Zavarzinella formosa]
MKALFLIADGYEDLQFFHPYYRLREEGITVTVAAATNAQSAEGLHGYTVEPDMPIPELSPNEYEILIVPGGRSPEKLRLREEAVNLVRMFAQDGGIVAAIGHGTQLLISAGVLDNKLATGDPGIRDDIRNADAGYRDEGVIVDGNVITCRGNPDLPLFCEQMLAAISTRVK